MLKVLDESIDLAKRFENVYDRITKVVSFEPFWRTNEGNRYANAVKFQLGVGEVAKTKDPETGRRIIFVGTDLDAVVVYERHGSSSKAQSFALVYDADGNLDFLLGGSFLSIAQFSLVVTDYDVRQNIGHSLQVIYHRIDRRVRSKERNEVDQERVKM